MTARIREMSAADTRARAAHSPAFLEAASLCLDETDPAYQNVSASLAVLAGIAASDAMCGHALKKAVQGQDHTEAVELLSRVSSTAARRLKALLAAKSTSQYGSSFITANRAREMLQQAQRLCDEMDALLAR